MYFTLILKVKPLMWETKNKPLEMIQAFSLMEAALHKILLVCAFCYLALIQSTPRHTQTPPPAPTPWTTSLSNRRCAVYQELMLTRANLLGQ